MMELPSGEIETDWTALRCPRSDLSGVPDTVSHIRSIPLYDPDTTRVLSGENATDVTESECPVKV